MDHSEPIVIDLSSDDEDDRDCVVLDNEDDCVILDCDPDTVADAKDGNGNEGDEGDDLVVVGQKGQIACRDFPHSRHLCASFPFSTTSHVQYCNMCHCYVCDSPAPCVSWGKGTLPYDHCHATDKTDGWKVMRSSYKITKTTNVGVNKIPDGTLQNSTPIPVHVSSHLLTASSSSNPPCSSPASVVSTPAPPINTSFNQIPKKSLSSAPEVLIQSKKHNSATVQNSMPIPVQSSVPLPTPASPVNPTRSSQASVVSTQVPPVNTSLNRIPAKSLSSANGVWVQSKEHNSAMKSLDKRPLKERNSALSHSKTKSLPKRPPVVSSKSKVSKQNSSNAVVPTPETQAQKAKQDSKTKRPVIVPSKKSNASVTSATETKAHQVRKDALSQPKTKSLHKQPLIVPSKKLSESSVSTPEIRAGKAKEGTFFQSRTKPNNKPNVQKEKHDLFITPSNSKFGRPISSLDSSSTSSSHYQTRSRTKKARTLL